MLVAIVLAEMVIVAIVPLNTGITYINSVVSMLFFIMAFTLALWTFVVCDTALSLDLSGGRHGLRRGWALKVTLFYSILISSLVSLYFSFSFSLHRLSRRRCGWFVSLALSRCCC